MMTPEEIERRKQIAKALGEAFKKMGDAQEARQAKERNQ